MKLTLRAARVQAGLTQEQVRERTGIARSSLTRWEHGKGKPRRRCLEKLCSLYGVTKDDLKTD